MSADYQCRLSHMVKAGETTITIRLREGTPYRGDRSFVTVVKRAKNSETAALRALKWYLE